MDRLKGKNWWEVLTGNSTLQQKPLRVSLISWDGSSQPFPTSEDLSPRIGTSGRFNTRLFLMSGVALHQNCQLNSQCYLPIFNSYWLTTSVRSHKILPTPNGLKEHPQGHHQSLQVASTAVQMLPQIWAYSFQYRWQGIVPCHPPIASKDLSGATRMKLLRISSKMAETLELALRNAYPFFACAALLYFWWWTTVFTHDSRRRPPQWYTTLPPHLSLGCVYAARGAVPAGSVSQLALACLISVQGTEPPQHTTQHSPAAQTSAPSSDCELQLLSCRPGHGLARFRLC